MEETIQDLLVKLDGLVEARRYRDALSEVAARFIDSPEFKGLADVNGLNGVEDFEFLNHMYKNVFGRAADQNGYVWWLSKLDDDTHSQATAFASMVQSDEFVLTTAATVADYLFV